MGDCGLQKMTKKRLTCIILVLFCCDQFVALTLTVTWIYVSIWATTHLPLPYPNPITVN